MNRSPIPPTRASTFARALRVAAALSLLASAGGCKLLRRTHPSGELARTASPSQHDDGAVDDTTQAWRTSMDLLDPRGTYAFEARSTGTLHVWMNYLCNFQQGDFALAGTLSARLAGQPQSPPVPVTITGRGAVLSGLPRGSYEPLVINAPEADPGRGTKANGRIYLFDIEAPQQASVTIEAHIREQPGTRCSVATLEVWHD